jgi:hypothetical protein
MNAGITPATSGAKPPVIMPIMTRAMTHVVGMPIEPPGAQSESGRIPSSSPLPTPMDAAPTPSEQCLITMCCEADCCGADMVYSKETYGCELEIGNPGWSLPYDSNYQCGCVERTCCVASCCSPPKTIWDSATNICIGNPGLTP